MADNFLNKTGLQYYHNRIKTLFENKIETVKVNGTALVPDANKAVNIEIDEAVFVATYGTTPAADIIAAIGAGKVICVTYGAGTPTEVVTFAAHNNGTAYLTTAGIGVESGVGFPTASTYTVSGTTWSVAIVQGANRAEVQAIQEVIPSDASDQNLLATQEWVDGAIDEALADITGFDIQVVQVLPATGQKGVIYLLPNQGQQGDIYDEYIWIDGTPSGHFEKIGNTAVDLTGYWAKTELTAITTEDIDTIVAG